MPSPFPGMDPYLESRVHWRGFRELFISSMTAALNATLPEGFAANVDERLYISWEQRPIHPDVAVIRRHSQERRTPGGVGVLELPAAHQDIALEIDLLEYEERESYIEVLQLGVDGSAERIVAMIEVISPANKVSSEGRDEYRRKQQTALRSSASFLEIDLLREGNHLAAAPLSAIRQASGAEDKWDYLISLHLGETPRRFRVWPRTVREPLPQILLPLAANVPGVALNLQAAFDQAYDAGPYRRRVDYTREPVPPLAAADAQWADGVLRERGLRPT